MNGGDGKAVGHLFERDLGRGLQALGGELGLGENERQSHSEASGMAAPMSSSGLVPLALEAAAEAIGIVLECAAFCGDGAFAILDSALSAADPWVCMSGSPCCGQVRSLWIVGRDVGSLSQAAAERNVLAGNLVERDHEIIRRNSGSRDHSVVQSLQ